jgi:hypothetical protein
MNERIKELISNAEIFANKTVPQLRGNETYWWRVRDEKFAELIIRECAKIAVEHEEYCEIKMMPTYAIDMHILERFGVEE